MSKRVQIVIHPETDYEYTSITINVNGQLLSWPDHFNSDYPERVGVLGGEPEDLTRNLAWVKSALKALAEALGAEAVIEDADGCAEDLFSRGEG